MHLRPRHYILIALILLLGVYNVMRLRRARHTAPDPIVRHTPVIAGPRQESPAWTAFDQAAALRDAPDAQFSPALSAFHKQTSAGSGPNSSRDLNPAPNPDPDLQGCTTWLQFYRQSILHPSRDLTWHNRSTEHLDSCVKYHRDLSS